MSDDELQLNTRNRYDDDDEDNEFSYSTKQEQKQDEKLNQYVSKSKKFSPKKRYQGFKSRN